METPLSIASKPHFTISYRLALCLAAFSVFAVTGCTDTNKKLPPEQARTGMNWNEVNDAVDHPGGSAMRDATSAAASSAVASSVSSSAKTASRPPPPPTNTSSVACPTMH